LAGFDLTTVGRFWPDHWGRSRALPGRSSAKGVALLMNAFGIYGNCWMGKQESPVQRLGSMSRRLHSRQRVGHM